MDAVHALALLLDACVCSRGVGEEQDIGYDLEDGDIAINRDG